MVFWRLVIALGAVCMISSSMPYTVVVRGQMALDTIRLTFPLQGLAHDTAAINTVFDHQLSLRDRRAYDADGKIVAFTGEFATSNIPVKYGCYSSPVEFRINGAYRSATGIKTDLCYEGHPGYDFSARSATVVAAADGRVVDAFDDCADNTHKDSGCPSPNGNYIVLEHEHGYKTFYLHLSQSSFKASELLGRRVTAGKVIAKTDNNGASTGEHLHFEVQRQVAGKYYPVDPYGWEGPGEDPYTTSNLIVNSFLWERVVYSYLQHSGTNGRTGLRIGTDIGPFSAGVYFQPRSEYRDVSTMKFMLNTDGTPNDGVVLKAFEAFEVAGEIRRGSLIQTGSVLDSSSMVPEANWYNGCPAMETVNADLTEDCFVATFTFETPLRFVAGQKYLVLVERTGSFDEISHYVLTARSSIDSPTDPENVLVSCENDGRCQRRRDVPVYTIWRDH